MTDIEIHGSSDSFRVRVRDQQGETQHSVSVPGSYLSELGLSDVDPHDLVEESFRFLLEREPKESIMRTFELSVIQRYFPEYPREIKRRLTSS